MNKFKLRVLDPKEVQGLSDTFENLDSARIWTSNLVEVLLSKVDSKESDTSEYVISLIVHEDDYINAYFKFLGTDDHKLAERECNRDCKPLSKLADNGDTSDIHKYLVSKQFESLGRVN